MSPLKCGQQLAWVAPSVLGLSHFRIPRDSTYSSTTERPRISHKFSYARWSRFVSQVNDRERETKVMSVTTSSGPRCRRSFRKFFSRTGASADDGAQWAASGGSTPGKGTLKFALVSCAEISTCPTFYQSPLHWHSVFLYRRAEDTVPWPMTFTDTLPSHSRLAVAFVSPLFSLSCASLSLSLSLFVR